MPLYHNETCGCAECRNYGQVYNPLAIHNQSCGCPQCQNYPGSASTGPVARRVLPGPLVEWMEAAPNYPVLELMAAAKIIPSPTAASTFIEKYRGRLTDFRIQTERKNDAELVVELLRLRKQITCPECGANLDNLGDQVCFKCFAPQCPTCGNSCDCGGENLAARASAPLPA